MIHASALEATLKIWMSGFSLPPTASPLYEMETADLALVRDFFALLLVHVQGSAQSPLHEARRHWPDVPPFSTVGLPSSLLSVTGIARKGSVGELVLKNLRQSLGNEQAAAYLALSELE